MIRKRKKSCSKWPEMARKGVENEFWICIPPPLNDLGYGKNVGQKKKKVVRNGLKWRENWLKRLLENKKIVVWKQLWYGKKVGQKKNQSCFNWPKMARKLFFLYPPLPPKKKRKKELGYGKCVGKKKKKLFQMT